MVPSVRDITPIMAPSVREITPIMAPSVRDITPIISDEIVEAKTGITHKPEEAEGSLTVGTITMAIIFALLAFIVFLDVVTFGKHSAKLKENLCPKKQEDEEVTVIESL